MRRDTAANWTSVNPVLASGEAGLETNTGKLKYGDGSTAWASLAYFTPQTITLTGDTTGSGTGSFATTIGANKILGSHLSADAIIAGMEFGPRPQPLLDLLTPGTFTSVSVNSKGLVTGGTNPAPVTPLGFDARLTLTSATPVTSSDVIGGTTLYLTPYKGDRVSLYTSPVWAQYTLSEISQTISGFVTASITGVTSTITSGSPTIAGMSSTVGMFVGMPANGTGIGTGAVIKSIDSSTQLTLSVNSTSNSTNTLNLYYPVYDVFLYASSGTPTFQFIAWTNNTTRATALTTQDGVLVQSGDVSKRYVGTVRLTSTTTIDDSIRQRFVWNYNGRVRKQLRRFETASSWTYAAASFRQANANALNQVEVVQGWQESLLNLDCQSEVQAATTAAFNIRIGEDSVTTAATEQMGGNTVCTPYGILAWAVSKVPTVGWHYYAWLENAASAVSCTVFQSGGLSGSWDC